MENIHGEAVVYQGATAYSCSPISMLNKGNRSLNAIAVDFHSQPTLRVFPINTLSTLQYSGQKKSHFQLHTKLETSISRLVTMQHHQAPHIRVTWKKHWTFVSKSRHRAATTNPTLYFRKMSILSLLLAEGTVGILYWILHHCCGWLCQYKSIVCFFPAIHFLF